MNAVETYRGIVYPWELDHMGHLNVQHYVRRFDEATWHFLHLAGITQAYLKTHRRGMAALEQTFKYRREVLAGSLLVIRSAPVEASRKTLRFKHAMLSVGDDSLVTEAEFVGAQLDLQTRRACPWPEGLPDFSRFATSPANG